MDFTYYFLPLKVDLNGHNRFQVGLALTALGNLGTADMCRDLAIEVDKHLKVSDAEECGCEEERHFTLFILNLNFLVAMKWFGLVVEFHFFFHFVSKNCFQLL